MLDSLTKTMSRSGGLVGGLNKKPNSSNNSLGGGTANVTAGSGTLSNGSHNSSTAGGRGLFQAHIVFLDDSGQVFCVLLAFLQSLSQLSGFPFCLAPNLPRVHFIRPQSVYPLQILLIICLPQIFDVEKKARGSQLLELVMNHLELREKEYFGLMFNDTGGVLPSGHSPDVMRWLDPLKPVRKQMRTAISGVGARTMPTLYLRVKFYVTGNEFLH